MKNILILAVACVALTALTACGADETAKNSNGSKEQASSSAAKATSSKLSEFMSEARICDVVDLESLQKTYNIQTEIKTRGSSHSNRYSCQYTWERSDADERMKALISRSGMTADGKLKKISMRERVTDSELSITLSESRRNLENYIPKKLSDEELQAQIDVAKQAADKRLTDEQKAVAGDMANEMVEKMLKKNNENQIIEGVGEAAYWTQVSFGALNVYAGGIEVYIAPMIADTEAEDIENAKLAFELLKK